MDFRSKTKSLGPPPLGQFCLEVQRREVEDRRGARKVNKMTEL